MPGVLSKYILKEILVPFLLSLSILTVTALLSKITKLVELAVSAGAGPSFVAAFLASVAPAFLIYTIPMSFLVAVLVAFTRLSSDHEVTAIKASGISLWGLMKPVLVLSIGVFVLGLCFTNIFFPWGNLSLKRLLFEAATQKLTAGVEEKTFYDRFQGITLYVDHVSAEGVFNGVFLVETSEKGSNVFSAERGSFAHAPDGSLYLELEGGTIHRRDDRRGMYHTLDFGSYAMELPIPEIGGNSGRTNRELYTGELADKVRALRANGEDPSSHVIDLHKRFALPASVFAFALIALPLGIQRVRTARLKGFTTGLVVIIIYYALSTVLEGLGENRLLHPALAVWGSDIILGCWALYVFYQAARERDWRPGFLVRGGS